MLFRVDLASAAPIHQQLAGQIRSAIANGVLLEGHRLPPARQLAASLDINMHTVLRAVQTLREEGLLEVRRGRGTVVTGVAPRVAVVSELAHSLVDEARRQGLADDEIRQLIEESL